MGKLADDLRTLSYEAYLFLYPLVTMDVTREQLVNLPIGAKPGAGPPNRFSHIKEFPDADFRAVVRPNFDTLYSSAWLDLTDGPVDVSVADTADRYYLLPMLDMWTDAFAVPGKRSTGTGAQTYTVVGPDHHGTVAATDSATVIHAPTAHVWVIGRTQTNGPDDYPAVNAIQDGFRITPHVATEFKADSSLVVGSEPLAFVNGLPAVEFFRRGAELLGRHPAHAADFSVLARIAGVGIVPGLPFDESRWTAAELDEIQAGATDALNRMRDARMTVGRGANGWRVATDSIGVYGTNYFQRAVIAMIGLGANPPEDAVYAVAATDTDGEPLAGERDYVIHFAADDLPPTSAFWSVTMYDAEGFQVANELDRFALGDRDPLTYNADGSLDLHISHRNPGPERESNWLPAPTGPLGVTFRNYAPHPEVLDGRWAPPRVRRL